mmetsp:Transcript_53799/g.107900  ORF Transcript_53799/g.107900 Transcript_53799/m.107900 type:complete len:425 (+) Transcript_53799:138-1412(+)
MISNRKLARQGSETRMSELDSSEVETETALDDEKASKISSTPTGGWQDLSGDWANIGLLLLLYTLQGVPMGLASSIPLLLQEKGATYGQQGLFSLVSWPFSLKILWAPIVDSWYNERFGRRKSWLVPVQLLCGLTMIAGGAAVNRMLGDGSEPPAVAELTMCFFMLHLLMATQDIAVDGWALTMLARRNVGWASTCNSIGQTLGYVVSFIIFMALNSADFCNTYLRASLGYAAAEQGMVTLGGFTAMWGCVFLVTTMLVWAFKSEKRAGEITMSQESTELEDEVNLDVRGAYSAMLQVVRLQPVGRLALVLLTSRVAFAAADSVRRPFTSVHEWVEVLSGQDLVACAAGDRAEAARTRHCQGDPGHDRCRRHSDCPGAASLDCALHLGPSASPALHGRRALPPPHEPRVLCHRLVRRAQRELGS